MRIQLHVIGLLALTAFGCSSGGTPPADAPAAKPAATGAASAQPRTRPTADAVGADAHEGVLAVMKGHGTVNGVLIPATVLSQKLGADWQKTAVGKRVRARGTLKPAHRCKPDEKCAYPDDIAVLEATAVEVLSK